MRKVNFILIAICLFMASCSSGDKDLLSMLPKETTAVVGINVESLIKKSGVTIEDGKIVLSKQLSFLEKDGLLTDSAMNIITNSGIDFSTKAYAFYLADKECGGILLKIKDDKDIAKLCEQKKLAASIIKKDKFSYVTVDGLLVCWSDNTLLLIGGLNRNIDNNIATAEGIFSDKGAKFDKNTEAISYLTKDNDYVGYVNIVSVVSELRKNKPVLSTIDTTQIAKAMTFTGDFNKDDITCDFNFIMDKNSEAYKRSERLMTAPSDKFLKLLPSDVDAIYSFGLNGSELLKVKEVEQTLGSIPFQYYGLSKENIVKLITDINGSITIALSNLSKNSNELRYYVSIESKDPQFLIGMINMIATQYGLQPITNGAEMVYSLGSDMSAVIGAKDGFFYCTVNGGASSGTADSDKILTNLYSKSQFGMYLNLKKDGNIAKEIMNDGGVFTMPGYFTMSLTKDWNINTKYVLVDNTQGNSLQALINQMNEVYKFEKKKVDEAAKADMDTELEPAIDELSPVE